MKLRQHDKVKETLKSDSNWEDYYGEIKPLLGLRELGFTRIFEYLNNIKDPVIVETGTVREDYNFEGDGCSTVLFDNYIKALKILQ